MAGLFNSPILELAIALFTLYLVLSLIASAVNEGVVARRKSRAAMLQRGLSSLLRHSSLAEAVLDHPTLLGLATPDAEPRPTRGRSLLPGPWRRDAGSDANTQRQQIRETTNRLRTVLDNLTLSTPEGQQAKQGAERSLQALLALLATPASAIPRRQVADGRWVAHHARHVARATGALALSAQREGHPAGVAQVLAEIASGLDAAVVALTASFRALNGGQAAFPSYISDVTFTDVLFDALISHATPGGEAGVAVETTLITLRKLRGAVRQLARGSAADRDLANALLTLLNQNQDPGGLASTVAAVEQAVSSLQGDDAALVGAVVKQEIARQQTTAAFLAMVARLPAALRYPFDVKLIALGSGWAGVVWPPAPPSLGEWLRKAQERVGASVPQEIQDALEKPGDGAQGMEAVLRVFSAKEPVLINAETRSKEAAGEWRELVYSLARILGDEVARQAGARNDPADYAALHDIYTELLANRATAALDREILLETIEGAQLNSLATAVAAVAPGPARDALLHLIAGDLDQARAAIQGWFNEAMDRLSGTYKRRTRRSLLIISVLIGLLIGADTIRVINHLSADQQLRTAVADSISKMDFSKIDPSKSSTLNNLDGTLQPLSSVLGYDDRPCLNRRSGATSGLRCLQWGPLWPTITGSLGSGDWWLWLVSKLLGILITATAMSLGAPFWFDLLNKLVDLRTSGTAPSTTGQQGSGTGGAAGK